VPNAAEKQGDFSQSNPACRPTPVDPLTGQPFPGNVIPANRISDAGYALLQLYPDANTSECINWVTALNVPTDWNQINARLGKKGFDVAKATAEWEARQERTAADAPEPPE